MRTATRGLIVRRGEVFTLAQAVDDGEDADDDEARAHQDVADEEDADDEVVEEGDEEEGDGVDEGVPVLLPAGDGRHDLFAGLADELGDGDDLVAVGAQGLDEHGQGATVAERSPPPSCSRMTEPRSPGLLGCMASICSKTLSVISCGVLRGCSSQSLVSILSPTTT